MVEIKYFEQIYTSATRLLEGGHGDLGIVAQTRGFPKDVAKELRFIQSYRLLDEISKDDLSLHPPRYVGGIKGKQKQFYCFVRVVFAGADHTSRTTPLAHTALFELEAMRVAGLTPADILKELPAFFQTKWQAEPQEFESQTNRTISCFVKSQRSFPSEAWQVLASDFSNVCGLFFTKIIELRQSSIPVVFVLDRKNSAMINEFISDLFAVLPLSLQVMDFQTHVFEQSEVDRDAKVLFTYPDTPFLNFTKNRTDDRAPFVIDLTTTVVACDADQEFISWLKKVVRSPVSARERIFEARQIREELGFDTPIPMDLLLSAIELLRSLQKLVSRFDSADFENASKLIQKISAYSKAARVWLDRKILRFMSLVKKVLNSGVGEDNNSDEYWPMLARISRDEHWRPGSKYAKAWIVEKPTRTFPKIVEYATSETKLKEFCNDIFLAEPKIITEILQKAISGHQISINTIKLIFEQLVPQVRSSDFCQWAEKIAPNGKENENAQAIHRSFLRYLNMLSGEGVNVEKARQILAGEDSENSPQPTGETKLTVAGNAGSTQLDSSSQSEPAKQQKHSRNLSGGRFDGLPRNRRFRTFKSASAWDPRSWDLSAYNNLFRWILYAMILLTVSAVVVSYVLGWFDQGILFPLILLFISLISVIIEFGSQWVRSVKMQWPLFFLRLFGIAVLAIMLVWQVLPKALSGVFTLLSSGR
jgi:hypothetical protein